MTVTIHKGLPSDAPWIGEFQIAMALETESMHLNPSDVKAGVAHVYSSNVGFYLTAKKNGSPVGCLLVLKEWSDWRNGEVWWIHSVYIKPDYRKHGIFKKMFNEVSALGKTEGCRGLRLYVDKTNTNARHVYEKIGMSNKHYEMFELMF